NGASRRVNKFGVFSCLRLSVKTPDERRTMVRDVIRESGLSKALLSEDSGLSRHTLRSWIVERTAPTPDSLHQLAAGLRSRAAKLSELADELDRAGEGS